MRDIRDRLREAPSPTITVLPDGSVDRRSAVVDVEGNPLSRETVGTEIAGDAKTFLTEWHGVEPGGQSVNAARQVHELGASTTLVGHLDHPIFDGLSFRTYSMGEPAEIHVYELSDGVTMFAAESTDISTWTFERFTSTVGPDAESLFAADAVLWTNWAAFPHGTAAITRLAKDLPDDTHLVIDPGAVSTRPERDMVEFLDTLGSVSFEGDVVLSPNRREANLLVDALGDATDDPIETAIELRAYADIDAVAIHAQTTATVATRSDFVEVPTVKDVEPTRHAGAGDRFSGAVAYGLALDWDWDETLTLGNACATHYLIHGRSGDRKDLRSMNLEY
ncbi:MAG: PfkB family carbohydrate kinase [Halobacteriota archaeon]